MSVYGDVGWYRRVLKGGDEEMYKGGDWRRVVGDRLVLNIDKGMNVVCGKCKVGVRGVWKEGGIGLKGRIWLFEGRWRR